MSYMCVCCKHANFVEIPAYVHAQRLIWKTLLSITAIWCTNRKSNVRRCGSGLYVGINSESCHSNKIFPLHGLEECAIFWARTASLLLLNPASCNACTHHVSNFYCHVSTVIPSCRYHKFSSVCEHLIREFNCTYQYANTCPGNFTFLV